MYQIAIDSQSVASVPLDIPGVSIRVLTRDAATGGMTVLTRIEAGATIPEHWHTQADETVFVIEGDFVEAGVSHGPRCVFRREGGYNARAAPQRWRLHGADPLLGRAGFPTRRTRPGGDLMSVEIVPAGQPDGHRLLQ